MDMDKLDRGCKDLSMFTMQNYDMSKKDWYINVQEMIEAGESDFEAFGKKYFDCDWFDPDIKEILNATYEGKQIFTYQMIKFLERIVCTRDNNLSMRMKALTYFRYVYYNKNEETGQELIYFTKWPDM